MLMDVMLNVLLTPEYAQHMAVVVLQQDHAQSYKTDIIWSLYAYPQETSTQDHPACLKHCHKKRNDTESSVQLSSVPFLFYVCLIWCGGSKQGMSTQGSDALVFCRLLP